MKRPVVNLAASKRLGRAVGAQPKACWWNALWTLREMHDRGIEGAVYVEGFAVSRFGLVLEHGWVEHRGRVIDPTPSWWASAREARYFPGVRYTLAEVNALAEKHPHEDGSGDPDLPLVWRTGGWAGWGVPSYRAANDDAYRATYGMTLTEMQEKLANVDRSGRRVS